jgi:hypothetical protein
MKRDRGAGFAAEFEGGLGAGLGMQLLRVTVHDEASAVVMLQALAGQAGQTCNA